MKNKKNEKGFSLVELLAVVVILGLLSAIAIVGVNGIIKSAEKKHYDTQRNTLKMAAQSYTQDNRNSLPKTIGGSTDITLKTLQDKKYVDEIKNRQGEACDVNKSYVKVFKYSKDGYNYTSYLVCPGHDDTKENINNAGPVISINYKDKNSTSTIKGDTIEISSYNTPTIELVIEKNKNGNEKGKNILSYNYVIYRCTTNASNKEVCQNELKNSGSIEAHQQSKVVESINIKEYLSNKIKIVVSSVDEHGNISTQSKFIKLTLKDGPECDVISEKDPAWITNPTAEKFREVQVKCIDKNGSGCEKEIYSQIFRDELYKGTIFIKDKSGKETACEVNVKIDMTPPTTPKITNSYNNKWTNKDYTITAESSDKTSGVEKFQYRYPNSKDSDERNWKDFGEKNKDKVTLKQSEERSEILEIRACDVAGNCSSASQTTIKIDKTAPTITISKTVATPNGKNNWYNTNVGINISTTDPVGAKSTAVASPITYGLTTSTNPTYNGVSSDVQKDTKGIIWYGYVKDEAGNTAKTNTESFKVDATPPSVTFGVSGSTASVRCSDNISGVLNSGTSWSLSQNITHSYTCENYAGLTNTGSKYFYWDSCYTGNPYQCMGGYVGYSYTYQCNCSTHVVCEDYGFEETGGGLTMCFNQTSCSTCTGYGSYWNNCAYTINTCQGAWTM